MWEEFYKFLQFLDRKKNLYPDENHFTIEMTQKMFSFAREIGFVSEDGYIRFNGCTFCLG